MLTIESYVMKPAPTAPISARPCRDIHVHMPCSEYDLLTPHELCDFLARKFGVRSLQLSLQFSLVEGTIRHICYSHTLETAAA